MKLFCSGRINADNFILKPYHSSTTSLLSSEGPKSLTRDSFFVDRIDKDVADEEGWEDQEGQGLEGDEGSLEELANSSPTGKGEKTMQLLGMSPPVSEARIQGPDSMEQFFA